MPLTEITDFQDFEEQLKTPLIRNNLVCRIFLFVNFNVFQYFNLFHLIKIEAIRAMGGKDLGSIVRTAWRETMSDELMSQFLWKGQIRTGSNKQPGLVLHKSKLTNTLFGKFHF